MKKDFKSHFDRKFSLREAYTLSRCIHPNIVQFVGAGPNTKNSDVNYIVLERAPNSSLEDREHLIPFESILY